MSYTNFNTYSHGTLRDMVQSMNSGEVMAASDPWRRAADTLKAIHASLGSASGEAAVDWEGSTSDAFYAKMTKLSNSINNTASYAHDAAETLKHMAEAIDLAKKTMPEEPGLWDQVTDAVGDTASSAFGGDDEDTKTAVTDEKKAQAAAVMQTLAMKYRVAKDVLQPPSARRDDGHDIPAPSDPTGAAAIAALITGAGLGGVGSAGGSGAGSNSGGQSSSRISGGGVGATPSSPKTTSTPAPTDPAIKGGSAHPVAKAPAPISFGPGTGIDGAVLAPSPTGSGSGHSGFGGGGSATGTGTTGSGGISGGLGHNGIGGAGYGSKGGVVAGGAGGLTGGQSRSGAAGSGIGRAGSGAGAARSGSAFGSGGMGEGGLGSGGRSGAGGRAGGGLARQAGGVAGEAGHGGTGTGRKSAFTEGGSGLGARSRAQGEQGQGGQGKGTHGQGVPAGDARRKKDKENGGRRPDYLVEDEETWVSGEATNPNVVE